MYNDLIPEFKNAKEAIDFLHIPTRRKCIKCKGKKEKNNNAYWCNSCLTAHDKHIAELEKSQAFYKAHPELMPEKLK